MRQRRTHVGYVSGARVDDGETPVGADDEQPAAAGDQTSDPLSKTPWWVGTDSGWSAPELRSRR